MDLTVPCPNCLELVFSSSPFCPNCRTDTHATTGLAPGELEQVRAAMMELGAAATAPVDLTGQPSRFRVVSHVFGLITVACALMAAFGGRDALDVGVIMGVLFGLIALLCYANDLVSPSARYRRTGLAAVNCYFRSVRTRRWSSAFACLSPIARQRPAARPPILDLGCPRLDITLGSKAELKSYWKLLGQAGGLKTRRISSLRYRLIAGSATEERYWVDLDIEYYPSLIMLLILVGVLPVLICYLALRRTQSMSFPVTVIKHRSQWWMVSGEVYPRIDRAMMPIPPATAGHAAQIHAMTSA